ncbi:hypothetical protein B0T20DRAFT_485053 [Sordaria brevicollis]|uniref:Uncharacterized protein n=1 Tax=Sordaria brevicollis TaxID=83679 RepID=A0AAE0UFU2_SORBR|nr:hypothetical protein B0T20DRAFT_485053 [Sordaria brevicollis]
MPSSNRKREREGGQDGANPTTLVAPPAPPALPAVDNPDPDALVGPYDGSRRYDQWKGMMYGHQKVVSGGGALFPTNFQINFNDAEPWYNLLTTICKQKAHRKSLLYDEIYRGLFWEVGKRKNPDKDSRFRPIVVTRGYFEPDDKRRPGDTRQPPENWECWINPTAARDIKTRIVQQVVAAPAPDLVPAAPAATPAVVRHSTSGASSLSRPNGNSIQEAIDISSDEEDVKPSFADLERANNLATSDAKSMTESSQTGGESHSRTLKGKDNGNGSDPFSFDPFESLTENRLDLNVRIPRKSDAMQQAGSDQLSIQKPSAQRPKNLPAIPGKQVHLGVPEIWRYMLEFLQPGTHIPDDEAVAELLTLPKRRDLTDAWKYRLAAFKKHDLKTYTSVVLYLGGIEAIKSPCNVMGCAHNGQAAEYAASLQKNGPGLYDRVFVKYAFPKCVFLPRHLHSSAALSKRLGSYMCANSYYRKQSLDDQIQYTKEQALEAQGKTIRHNPSSHGAHSSPAQVPQIITPTASSTNSRSNLTIRGKPKLSDTFHLPEGNPGQVFSLKGADTKIIQASRNQTLECKVLKGSGVKVTIVGGKKLKVLPDRWDSHWTLEPDCQCLVENIYANKSFGENATSVDVNLKKGGTKTGPYQVAPFKGKWDDL